MQLVTDNISHLSNYTQEMACSPEEIAEARQQLIDIGAAIALLDPRTAAMLHKRFYEDKTYKQIGIDFNLSTGRVQQIVKKAMRKLGTSLREYRPVIYDDLWNAYLKKYNLHMKNGRAVADV